MTSVSAVAALDEPTRRKLYDYVIRRPDPVSRDEAAAEMALPRTTVAFHLDKLVAEGLLSVVHQRRSGRSGPGAGRPMKLYRRSDAQITVSLPQRRYELAARLLAAAVEEAEGTGRSPRGIVDERARELGAEIAAEAGEPRGGPGETVMRMLENHGFEPRDTGERVVLGNCPFHHLAARHTALVCGMNRCLIEGMLGGLTGSGFTARLEPTAGHCCVQLERSRGS